MGLAPNTAAFMDSGNWVRVTSYEKNLNMLYCIKRGGKGDFHMNKKRLGFFFFLLVHGLRETNTVFSDPSLGQSCRRCIVHLISPH